MSSAPFIPRELAPAGRKNVVRILEAWYPACSSGQLQEGPLARLVCGVPLVLFRDKQGKAAALLDRCPHRNVPLSIGSVRDGDVVCRYHGWRFDGCGELQSIPGLPVVNNHELSMPGRRCMSFPVVERHGLVFVWTQPHVEPRSAHEMGEPFDLGQVDWRGYYTFRWEADVEGTLHSTLENILDVPHTSFLHGGLFRQEAKKNALDVVVRRRRHMCEAEFIGEPRPPGVAGKLLSPSGGIVEHVDRFFLPSTAQVEYKLGTENHLVTTTICTPVTETRTRMFTALSLRTRVPTALIAPIVMPIAWKILAQDKWILDEQTDLVDRFGTETFTSTSIDMLGPHILHLLKKAEAGALDDAIVRDEQLKLLT